VPPAGAVPVSQVAAAQAAPGTVAEQTLAAAVQRLTKIPGIDVRNAQVILAEIGLDMNRFPTAGHLASWAKLTPRTIQSGTKNTTGKTGKGNGYLKGALGPAAASAARTNTFLGARYRRLVKRRGKLKALVAVARSVLTIIWHLLSQPTATFHDLGVNYHSTRIDKQKKIRTHIQQLQTLGYTVTLTPTA
jgi:transposase